MVKVMEKSVFEQLKPIFEPRTVAVIGASDNPNKFGGRAFLYPSLAGYRGTIYPVNPNREAIAGVKAYPGILDVPDDIDMVVIAVPASLVPQAMEECVRKGVKGAVMITAGFAETSEEGRELQDEVVRIAHEGGIRFVGPNCMGIASSSVRLNLCFDTPPLPGPISFVSQSGTLGVYLFQTATSKGYGFSKFISSGNQASIDMTDYLEYLVEDDDTRVIVLYMESSVGAKKFFETAREVVKRKPIVVYKGGRTTAGSRATLSHTASLAGSDEIFDVACRQAGIIRCAEAFHIFELAEALAHQPLPRGKRIAIIGSGGYCVCAADACASLGLEIPELDEATKRSVKGILAPHAPIPTNPIDTAATPDPMVMPKILDIVAKLDYIDGMIAIGPLNFRTQGVKEIKSVIEQVEGYIDIPKKYNKPLIITGAGNRGSTIAMDLLTKANIPHYVTPEDSARAMYGLAEYGEIIRRCREEVSPPH
jgi:acetyltransferase